MVNWIRINNSPISFIDKKIDNVISNLFFVLYEDVTFQQQFWNRYQTVLDSGKISAANFETIIRNNLDKIEIELPLQIEQYGFPKSMIEWYGDVDNLSSMFEEREKYIKKMVRSGDY